MGYEFMMEAAGAPGTMDGETGTFDTERYRDPLRFGREVESCLDRSWVLCVHSSQLAEGDHRVWEGWGRSVVISRSADGLHAFHNVCRHRGAQLVEGAGQCEPDGFRCPWHGWRYDAEGRIVAVPRRSLFDDDQIDRDPAPIGIAEWWGFIWLNLAGGATPTLEKYLGGLVDELDSYGLDDWQLAGEDEWEVNCNWKTLVDGFGEDYHARDVHAATIPRGLVFESTRWRLLGPHSMMVTPLHGVDYSAMDQPVDHRATAYCHYSAFPTSVLSCFPRHAQIMSVVPLKVDRSKLRVWIIGHGDHDDDRRRRELRAGQQQFRDIANEDLGVISRIVDASVTPTFAKVQFGRAERRLTLFHDTVDRCLASDTDPLGAG